MKIGISAWIQMAKVWDAVFMIAGTMNGVKLTAFGNSKSTLMIAPVRFVKNYAIIQIRNNIILGQLQIWMSM